MQVHVARRGGGEQEGEERAKLLPLGAPPAGSHRIPGAATVPESGSRPRGGDRALYSVSGSQASSGVAASSAGPGEPPLSVGGRTFSSWAIGAPAGPGDLGVRQPHLVRALSSVSLCVLSV